MRCIAGLLLAILLVGATGCRSTYDVLFDAMERNYTAGGSDSWSRSQHFHETLDRWEQYDPDGGEQY